jgi:hypothetical protein
MESEVNMGGVAFTKRGERRLVIGLGNALAGDDGVGSHVIRQLNQDERLPGDVDVLETRDHDPGVTLSHELSPDVESKLDGLVDAVLDLLSGDPAVARAMHSPDS